MAAKDKRTPLMQQYYRIKRQYPDALLLFRVGDFYETFGDDAVKTAETLGIVLTKRGNGSEADTALAGFPYHALNTYLPKLVRAGHRVAICEQLEDPKKAKKIVKRGVTEVVTPGLAYSDTVLDKDKNNFLAAVYFGKKYIGLALTDVSTGEFYVTRGGKEYIGKLLRHFAPKEIIFSRPDRRLFEETFGKEFYTYPLDEWVFQRDYAEELLRAKFETASLKGFGIHDLDEGVIAAGSILHYLKQNLNDRTDHIRAIRRLTDDQYVWMDDFTVRNLELLDSPHGKEATLLGVLDKTLTPPGGRLLRRWILFPLKDREAVEKRLDVTEALVRDDALREKLSAHLKSVGDQERMLSRIVTGKANPRETVQLNRALRHTVPIKEALSAHSEGALREIGESLHALEELQRLISTTLVPDPPAQLNKGGVIAEGVSPQLDELRAVSRDAQGMLDAILQREIARTGIHSLKIGYNNVFGYYLEVRNKYKERVPSDWVRKQTLTASERYITPELKELETKILGAEEQILALEERLYRRLLEQIKPYVERIQQNARVLARLDVLLSFAKTAVKNYYVRPSMNDGYALDIKQGRHPVIERHLPEDQTYVANDVYLDRERQQILIITGPNMSGKSAFLRQTALIVLMAQMGSFVPARSADIGIIDKIFTRVGASDNIAMGESTFMVEMNETASILHNLSPRSLILLDEIGRGTSTYDGISIAWAIAEYLHEHPARPKTLFATHYHELNEMEKWFPRIKNFHVSVKEHDGRVIFMRKLRPGGSAHSFGIHVAKLAGMPSYVIRKAEKMLKQLEETHRHSKEDKPLRREEPVQLSFIQLDDPLLEEIRDMILRTDIDNLRPVDALNLLDQIKNKLEK
ncbi:MAG: DNA mismatch repair protein MutS [Chlorobi bacterium]|nr:DNA mismatch repair protein MutS [Chlorobiota bacterium]